jgi:hypothetical protein
MINHEYHNRNIHFFSNKKGDSASNRLSALFIFFNRRRTQTRADLFIPRPDFALASFATASPRDKKHVNHADRVIIFTNVPV